MSYANPAVSPVAQPETRPGSVPGCTRFIDRVPLRISLTIGMLCVLFVGIVLSNVAIATIQWNSSVRTIDKQLIDARYGWAAHPGLGFSDPRSTLAISEPPSHYFLYVEGSDGSHRSYNDHRTRPDLAHVPADGAIHQVPSLGEGSNWRVIRYPVELIVDWEGRSGPRMVNGTATVGLPLADAQLMLHNMVMLQLLVGTILMLGAGGVAWIVVWEAFTPLRKVEDAAADIATGDYSRRVPLTGYTTEVEALALSFNRMAEQVEETFEEQHASEELAHTREAALRRFVGDASHELRTPLTAVRGFAEAARMGAIDTAVALTRIEEESRRMQRLVEDLLLLARMDNNRPFQLGELTEVTLGPVLTSAVEAARVSWPDRTIVLTITDPAIVVGDENKLRQVVDNLLANALLHAGEAAHVRVGLRVDPTHDHALVMVSDNGCGMDEETTRHVFDRFFRGDTSRGRNSGDRHEGRGSGLGLAIVKSLVDTHGGSVSVTSHVGEGSQFVVTLPLAVETSD